MKLQKLNQIVREVLSSIGMANKLNLQLIVGYEHDHLGKMGRECTVDNIGL